jgi:TDG/mug DNA glycosylase family protein
VLEDVLSDHLAVVFCVTAPTDRPAREQAYYAGRRNKFWSVLFRTKLTPRQFRPEEYTLVLAHDIGLTELRRRGAIGSDDYDVDTFRKNIAEHRPAIVAFNGKDAAKRCLNRETVSYGRQKETYEAAAVTVLPSTAEQAHAFWDEKYWNDLAAEVRKLRARR